MNALSTNIPSIVEHGGSKVLLVGGRPFVALAGEVHNSSASSRAYMDRALTKAVELGLNTVAAPVTWELVEPEEGRFEFGGVDRLIDQARKHGLHLILLWFGAWKNAQCFYAPEWVKRDTDRFRRAEVEPGKRQVRIARYGNAPYSTLSALCDETRYADARAFAELMAHVRDYDQRVNTVVAVQVENECGLMTTARERSAEADALFASEQVPEGLVAFLREHEGEMADDVRAAFAGGKNSVAKNPTDATGGKNSVAGIPTGTWEEVFDTEIASPVAAEMFQAYHTARYVEAVASAGKAAYPLPMMVNCWLDKGNEPGRYPSGGPVARAMEVWRWAAPSIDVVCPDIYVRNFCDVCDQYRKLGNPLGVVETATHSYAAPRAIWAVGHHHAPVFGPFGFEEMGEPFTASQGFLFGMDVNDPALSTPQNSAAYAAAMHGLAGLVNAWDAGACDMDKADAVISERGLAQELGLGSWRVGVTFTEDKPGAALAAPVSWDAEKGVGEAFLLVQNCSLAIGSRDDTRPNLDILALEDGSFENGAWQRDRRLNGDEAQILDFEAPTLLRLRVLLYA